MSPARQSLVDEAKTWIGTPFMHHQCVKGVGVDCCTILSAIYERILGTKIVIPEYSVQWNQHPYSDNQPYLNAILQHCTELSAFPNEEFVPKEISYNPKFRGFPVEYWDHKPPLPADIGLWWFGRAWAHVTIIVDWPTVLNPMMNGKVTLEAAQTVGSISSKFMRMRAMRLNVFA